jgi:hypothetical protein
MTAAMLATCRIAAMTPKAHAARAGIVIGGEIS